MKDCDFSILCTCLPLSVPLVNFDSVGGDTGKITDVASVNGAEVVQIVGDLEVFDGFVV